MPTLTHCLIVGTSTLANRSTCLACAARFAGEPLSERENTSFEALEDLACTGSKIPDQAAVEWYAQGHSKPHALQATIERPSEGMRQAWTRTSPEAAAARQSRQGGAQTITGRRKSLDCLEAWHMDPCPTLQHVDWLAHGASITPPYRLIPPKTLGTVPTS